MIAESLTRESILLDDIAKVERMIELHSSDKSDFMRDQYASKRGELIKKLEEERNKLVDTLDNIAIKKVAMTIRAINHKVRQRIIKLLKEHEQMSITDIYTNLSLDQFEVSQHLAILRRADIVVTKRDGKFIKYNLNYALIAAIVNFISHMDNSEQE